MSERANTEYKRLVEKTRIAYEKIGPTSTPKDVRVVEALLNTLKLEDKEKIIASFK